jgi:tagatose-1,6-bisphosphate aldolase non-catalytic subunit AgaZ/GatZ
MVEDGFAILKTGQSQTAMAREAVFMLAKIESELTRESNRRPALSILRKSWILR